MWLLRAQGGVGMLLSAAVPGTSHIFAWCVCFGAHGLVVIVGARCRHLVRSHRSFTLLPYLSVSWHRWNVTGLFLESELCRGRGYAWPGWSCCLSQRLLNVIALRVRIMANKAIQTDRGPNFPCQDMKILRKGPKHPC